jgi:membrane protein
VGQAVLVGQVANMLLFLILVTLLFGMLFKALPDVEIPWRYVWIGAAVTSLLFNVGRWLIGLYLGRAGMASPYGAAGSLAMLLLWVYYSAQIFFLGAEFTQVYARRSGARIMPARGAVRLTGEAPAH